MLELVLTDLDWVTLGLSQGRVFAFPTKHTYC